MLNRNRAVYAEIPYAGTITRQITLPRENCRRAFVNIRVKSIQLKTEGLIVRIDFRRWFISAVQSVSGFTKTCSQIRNDCCGREQPFEPLAQF